MSVRVCDGLWNVVEIKNEWMESKVSRQMLGMSRSNTHFPYNCRACWAPCHHLDFGTGSLLFLLHS